MFSLVAFPCERGDAERRERFGAAGEAGGAGRGPGDLRPPGPPRGLAGGPRGGGGRGAGGGAGGPRPARPPGGIGGGPGGGRGWVPPGGGGGRSGDYPAPRATSGRRDWRWADERGTFGSIPPLASTSRNIVAL